MKGKCEPSNLHFPGPLTTNGDHRRTMADNKLESGLKQIRERSTHNLKDLEGIGQGSDRAIMAHLKAIRRCSLLILERVDEISVRNGIPRTGESSS